MSQQERTYKILNLLRQHRALAFSSIQSKLEVSRSTLKRDLQFMRDRIGVQIQWDRDTGCYSLSNSSPHARQELPSLWFSPSEIQALLTMQHLLAHVDTGGLLALHIDPLKQRLEALMGQGQGDTNELRERVRIIGLAQRAVKLTHFQTVGDALIARKRLQITYLARGQQSMPTQREVSPLRLVHYRENWYLDAWCHLRNALRNFAVDCIQSANLQDVASIDISDAKLDAIFGPSYGIFSGGRVRWAILQFSPERTPWIKDEQWHPHQQGKLLPQGGYLLRIPYTDHRELMMDILKHGAHCEVRSPKSLRASVALEVEKMGEKYFEKSPRGSSGEPPSS